MRLVVDRHWFHIRRTLTWSCTVAVLALGFTPGCIERIWERDDDALIRMLDAPPIMQENGTRNHLVVLQAPSPGWSIRLDATERTPEGKRIYLTIRQPDPAYEYPQQIVLMRVLTNVGVDTQIELVGRMLEHNEGTKNKGYASVELVDSFQ